MNKYAALLFVGLIIVLMCVIVLWATIQTSRRTQDVLQQQNYALPEEKTRQETISLRIENERKSLFWVVLLTNFGAAVGITVAIIGGWTGLQQYFRVRNRERIDRVVKDLSGLWKGACSNDRRERVHSLVGLQHFLSPEMRDYHSRILSCLALAVRSESDQDLLETLTPIVENAFRSVSPNLLRRISWQHAVLRRPDFAGLDLKGVDFRDCCLENACFAGADLNGAKFNAARLNGADLSGANLRQANLEYADLAGAVLRGADLRGAVLRHAKILDADFREADLRGLVFRRRTTDWGLARNWRSAQMDSEVRRSLHERLGPRPSGPRVLMLMWEFPPHVSGGGWTAPYHFIKSLRKEGADILVLVPWARSKLCSTTFGNEVQVLGATMEFPDAPMSTGYSPYSTSSPYALNGGRNDVSAYELSYGQYRALHKVVGDFATHAVEILEDGSLSFDVIHAHDWVTFPAAQRLSKATGKPWIAHFHSVEADRRPNLPDTRVQAIERSACSQASRIVTPSLVTKQVVANCYSVSCDKIVPVPNCLCDVEEDPVRLGRHDTQRVVFIGRLASQKAPLDFLQIAARVHLNVSRSTFHIWGRADTLEDENRLRDAIARGPQVVFGYDGESHNENPMTAIQPIRMNLATGKWKLQGHPLVEPALTKIACRLRKQGFLFFPEHKEIPCSYRVIMKCPRTREHTCYLVESGGRYWGNGCPLIEINGFLPWEQRRLAFENASVVVVPSQSEPFGMVILEAMQSGVPVVFIEHAGAAEVLHSGFRFQYGDVDKAAEFVTELLTSPDKWEAAVQAQLRDIAAYPDQHYENRLKKLWSQLAGTAN